MFPLYLLLALGISPVLDLVHLDHPALAVKITNQVRLAGSEDGVLLDIIVHNRLPCVWSLLFWHFTLKRDES